MEIALRAMEKGQPIMRVPAVQQLFYDLLGLRRESAVGLAVSRFVNLQEAFSVVDQNSP